MRETNAPAQPISFLQRHHIGKQQSYIKMFIHRITVLRTKHQQNACAPHIGNAKQHRQIQFYTYKPHETSFKEPDTISFIA